MPSGLKRFYGAGDLHFITCSCYRRLPLLGTSRRRDAFLRRLEEVRIKYDFAVIGYVVMPEHFHLLMTEPRQGNPSLVMQVLKQRVSRGLRKRTKRKVNRDQADLFHGELDKTLEHFWQKRFYDFNVWTEKKRVEKLKYMHQNPVKRGLVDSPELWRWSSFRFYSLQEQYIVKIDLDWGLAHPFAARKDGAPPV